MTRLTGLAVGDVRGIIMRYCCSGTVSIMVRGCSIGMTVKVSAMAVCTLTAVATVD